MGLSKKFTLVLLTLTVGLSSILTSCSQTKSNLSPAETFKAFRSSVLKHDVESFKKTASKQLLKKFEEGATNNGQTLEQKLIDASTNQTFRVGMGFDNEIRDGKIEGDKASVEQLMSDGAWRPLLFTIIKEDGEWRVDL